MRVRQIQFLALATSAYLAATLGCQRTADPAPEADLYTSPNTFSEDVQTLQRADATTTVVPTDGELRPVAEMSPNADRLVWTVNGPQLLRLTQFAGKNESPLMDVPARAGQVLVMTRDTGIQLGDQTLRKTRLDDGIGYRLYVLPPGGIRNEATRTVTRVATEEEKAAALEKLREQREAQEQNGKSSGATTQPSTKPDSRSGGEPPG